MNMALRKPWTLDEFLEWEDRQHLRHEFDGLAPVAMVGGTEAHALIQAALISEVRARLRGSPCRVVGSELKLRLSTSVRYPDAMILCSPVQGRRTAVDDPVVVFEILSPSTARTDIFAKNAEYRSTPSIQRYVILEQTHPAAVAFFRSGDLWATEIIAGHDAILSLPEVGVDVPLADIYRDIEPDPEDAPAS